MRRQWQRPVDAAGVVTLAGRTSSTDFPVTAGAWDTTPNAGYFDAYLVCLDPSQPGAQQLRYATFLGGYDVDDARAVAVDSQGIVTLAGLTRSNDFPTTIGAWDTTHGNPGVDDAFVARLDPSQPVAQQHLVYATFLGGVLGDSAAAVSVDATGIATVVGTTSSPTFPTTSGAWDITFSGSPLGDAFVSRLDPSQSRTKQLVYSTFLGSGSAASALWIDAAGAVTVVGSTFSPFFPTTLGAFDTTIGGVLDAFVSRLDPRLPQGQQLTYATLLGGSQDEWVYAARLDAAERVTLVGNTTSGDFTVTRGALDVTFGDSTSVGGDAFLARLDPNLASSEQLAYATFLGGAQDDFAYAVHFDASDVASVAGYTTSADFPTTPGAWSTTRNGQGDATFVRLDLLPTGATRFGTSSAGCMGPLTIGVTAMPFIGNATFTITCSNAPPSTTGILVLASGGSSAPTRVLGIDLWIDAASTWLVTASTTSNTAGAAYFALPVPNNPWLVQQTLNAQFVWSGPGAPPPCPPLGVSASDALRITIQR